MPVFCPLNSREYPILSILRLRRQQVQLRFRENEYMPDFVHKTAGYVRFSPLFPFIHLFVVVVAVVAFNYHCFAFFNKLFVYLFVNLLLLFFFLSDPDSGGADPEVRSEASWAVLNATSCGSDHQVRLPQPNVPFSECTHYLISIYLPNCPFYRMNAGLYRTFPGVCCAESMRIYLGRHLATSFQIWA